MILRELECSCGAKYRDQRTGLTFKAVRRMLFTSDPDPKAWRNKGRRAVLGFWHELKWSEWQSYHGGCDA